jgi:Arc/MetJ family transcription regulator
MTREISRGHPVDILDPEVAPMPKTLVDVDDALLSQAQQLLGTSTKKDTINQALAEVIKERRRQEAVESEIRRYEAGQYELLRNLGDQP